MNNEENKIDISTVTDFNELEKLMSNSAFRHTFYYHYSDIEGINGILDSKTIWLSSMMFSNDLKEHSRFSGETYTYFQLCFSCGTTENLPLWFLYSGRNGKGARISFTRSSIQEWFSLRDLEMYLICIKTKERTLLIPNKNCFFEFRDILYAERENEKYRVKHNGKINNDLSIALMDIYQDKCSGFIKDIIWFYEKEARLLVKVKKELLDSKMFQNARETPYRIELKIPANVYRNINLTLSPTYSVNNADAIQELLRKKGFEKLSTEKILSKYSGQINIDLCKKCDKNNKCSTCEKNN